MLEFHTPALADKPWVDAALTHSNHRGCLYTFAQMYVWADQYKTQICKYNDVSNDAVLIRGGTGSDTVYIYPAGQYELSEIIPLLKQDAAEIGAEFRMVAVEKWQADELMNAFPGQFSAQESRDSFDYIYRTADLINLPGKKYHRKRNHISQFVRKFPDWSYQQLCDENAQEFSLAAKLWCEQNGCEEDMKDYCALVKAILERNELSIIGGAIRTGGEIAAFTLGERLNNDTFVIHFEKALEGFDGGYTLINREFAAHNLNGYTYINREEDLGIEGLRKAKLSYYPAILLEKYTIKFKV